MMVSWVIENWIGLAVTLGMLIVYLLIRKRIFKKNHPIKFNEIADFLLFETIPIPDEIKKVICGRGDNDS